jgi:hypothetical protein
VGFRGAPKEFKTLELGTCGGENPAREMRPRPSRRSASRCSSPHRPCLDLEAPVSGDLASVPLDEVIAASSADVEAGPFRHDSIG